MTDFILGILLGMGIAGIFFFLDYMRTKYIVRKWLNKMNKFYGYDESHLQENFESELDELADFFDIQKKAVKT